MFPKACKKHNLCSPEVGLYKHVYTYIVIHDDLSFEFHLEKIHPRSPHDIREAYIRQWKKDGMIDDSKPEPRGPESLPTLGPSNGGFLSHKGTPKSSSISNDGILHEINDPASWGYPHGNPQMGWMGWGNHLRNVGDLTSRLPDL